MKTRNIPFGYKIENGKICLHPAESKTVNEIFTDYMNGQSLLQIAKSLNNRQVEYLPRTTGWNKARLKRIIEDIRYLGNDNFPAIIEQAIFDKAQEIKSARNTQKAVNRNVAIFKLNVPILCEQCGEPMYRIHDSRTTHKEKWICRSCGSVIKIADNTLLSTITECMNRLIENPKILKYQPVQTETPMETIRLRNELGRQLDSPTIDKEPLKNKIFEYASLLYSELDSGEHITKNIRATLENTRPLSLYNDELIDKTISAVILHADGTVSLILKNGQQIRKEKSNGTANTAKTGTHHSADHTAGECAQRSIHNQTGSRLLPGIHQAG